MPTLIRSLNPQKTNLSNHWPPPPKKTHLVSGHTVPFLTPRLSQPHQPVRPTPQLRSIPNCLPLPPPPTFLRRRASMDLVQALPPTPGTVCQWRPAEPVLQLPPVVLWDLRVASWPFFRSPSSWSVPWLHDTLLFSFFSSLKPYNASLFGFGFV